MKTKTSPPKKPPQKTNKQTKQKTKQTTDKKIDQYIAILSVLTFKYLCDLRGPTIYSFDFMYRTEHALVQPRSPAYVATVKTRHDTAILASEGAHEGVHAHGNSVIQLLVLLSLIITHEL